MKKLDPTMAEQVAQAVSVFQEQRTGYPPKAVSAVLSDDTLVVTLREALSPAEKAMAATPEGAAQVQEFHRQLFNNSVGLLREEIKRITGIAVGEAAAEVEIDDRRRRACIYNRHHGAGVPARRQDLSSGLEREWSRRSRTQHGGFAMLVLSRKNGESVVIGGSGDFHRLLKVTVLGIRGAECEAGLRGRSRCASPSFGGVGTDQRKRQRGESAGNIDAASEVKRSWDV